MSIKILIREVMFGDYEWQCALPFGFKGFNQRMLVPDHVAIITCPVELLRVAELQLRHLLIQLAKSSKPSPFLSPCSFLSLN